MDMRGQTDKDYDRTISWIDGQKKDDRKVCGGTDGRPGRFVQTDTKWVDIQYHRLGLLAFSLPNAEQKVLSYGPATFCWLCYATAVWLWSEYKVYIQIVRYFFCRCI